MTDMTNSMNFSDDDYHMAHVKATAAKISHERIQRLGTEIANCFYLGSQGPLPSRTNRRRLKPVQLHAIGAITLMLLQEKQFMEGLRVNYAEANLCSPVCPNHPGSEAISPSTEMDDSDETSVVSYQ